jgi:hypothetical protein
VGAAGWVPQPPLLAPAAASWPLRPAAVIITIIGGSTRLPLLPPLRAGAHYEVDLLKKPFMASQPLEVLSERTPDAKHLLLFDMATMSWEDPLQGLF